MEPVNISGIEIDRCTRCKGIWFDQKEQTQIKSVQGSYKADTGHQAIGEHYNTLRDVDCPRCDVPMGEEELKRGRVPIQIETCPKCHGTYFDAGEFRDFAEPTILEFAKGLLSKLTEGKTGNDD